VSWAAHEFETYFIQKHVGTKASYLAICVGTFLPDLVTKHSVYEHRLEAAHGSTAAGRASVSLTR
jgi:hypothetical protein